MPTEERKPHVTCVSKFQASDIRSALVNVSRFPYLDYDSAPNIGLIDDDVNMFFSLSSEGFIFRAANDRCVNPAIYDTARNASIRRKSPHIRD
jgi:hypothetical protein